MADAFIAACKAGELETVRDSLTQGADPNAVDQYGWPPVVGAAFYGHVAVCQVLINADANLEARAPDGATPLCIAAQQGNAELAALLLAHRAAVDAPRPKYGDTPLCIAAQQGNAEVAALLLKHGAAVDAADNNGQTPLSMAAQLGHPELVALLVDNGADVHRVNSLGANAVWLGAFSGNAGVVRTLLLLGVDLAIKTNPDIGEQANMTPLDIARHKGHAEIAADLRHPANLCAARQRLALAVGVADEAHVLLGALPLELVRRVCAAVQAQAASALVLGRTELRMRRAAAALPAPARAPAAREPEPEPEPEPQPAAVEEAFRRRRRRRRERAILQTRTCCMCM